MVKTIELRSYQADAVKAMVSHNRGICVAPAGSGKTIIAAQCVLQVGEVIQGIWGATVKAAWICHTKEQREQALQAIQAVAIHHGGSEIEVSCYAGSNSLLSEADILIIDECHWAGCDQVKGIIRAAVTASFIYGFTATPERQDGIDITEIIGPIRYRVERDVIQAAGGVVPAEVRVIEIPDPMVDIEGAASELYSSGMQWKDRMEGTDDCWKRCVYRAAAQYAIRENTDRNAIITAICLTHTGDSVLVLVDTKDHGKALEGMIPGAVFVSSGTGMRGRKMEAFKQGKTPVLICTQLADEGLDTPIAGVLVLAAPGKAAAKVIQRTGRVLRPHPGKDRGIIYEFRDLSHGMLTAQHWGRVKVYKQQGYRIVRANI